MMNLNEILAFSLDSKIFGEQVETFNEHKIQEKSHQQRRRSFTRLKKQKTRKSFWNLEQNLTYASYLQNNKELFGSSVAKRRSQKINQLVSKAVGTRSPQQCKSHHQKMIKFHKDINGIIQHIKKLKQLNFKQFETVERTENVSLCKKQIVTVAEDELLHNLAELEGQKDKLRFPEYQFDSDSVYS